MAVIDWYLVNDRR